jgi:hypothetical protein
MAASSILEAHTQWRGDLERISEFELNDGIPDHFKQAGHLAYWLRRCKPIYELNENKSYPPAGTKEDVDFTTDGQELLLKYANEYLAFSLGYHICLLHTITDEKEAKEFRIDKNYLEIVCQFLRNKNVSPHALYLIYRSLFHRAKQ